MMIELQIYSLVYHIVIMSSRHLRDRRTDNALWYWKGMSVSFPIAGPVYILMKTPDHSVEEEETEEEREKWF